MNEPDKVFDELTVGINNLPADQARVLQMYYVESMTWQEICYALKTPIADVRALYWEAISTLRPQLELANEST